MKNKNKKVLTCLLLIFSGTALGAPFVDFGFRSPAFNGIGYSNHVQTIENQEASRRKAIQDKIEAELAKKAAEQKNSNLNKFLNNLESRIYAQISQNLANAMFATGGSNSGTLNFEGNTIFWTKDDSNVYMQVTDTVGNVTNVTVPLGQFRF